MSRGFVSFAKFSEMKSIAVVFSFSLLLVYACSTPGAKEVSTEVRQVGETYEREVLQHPAWSRNATIYEVNIRQHTPEGTLLAFEADIPRLKDLGVTILWLMPVHPIGKENRKGGLGSYYAAADYKAVNPEFGTFDDLKSVVSKAHSYGMKVILDWVANHTAFDHVWTKTNPEYYLLDSLDQLQPPLGTDWFDVAQLDYENTEMREAMIDAMKFWLTEAGVDGFRCDVADFVPIDFWEKARKELMKVEPDLFMLAEAETPEHHFRAFNMSYSWELMHIMNQIAKGEKALKELDAYMMREDTNFVGSAYRMAFTTNHDENSWNGTVFERYGNAHLAFAALAFTINGMPLIYSGQEAGSSRALRFFEKDTIQWGDYMYEDFYQRLMRLNQDEEALWNGHYGGEFVPLETADPEVIYAFMRRKGESAVITMINLSNETKKVTIKSAIPGNFQSIFNNQVLSVFTNGEVVLEPNGYQVFKRVDS